MTYKVLNEENEPLIDRFPVSVKLITLDLWKAVCLEKECIQIMDILQDSNKTLDEITREYKEKYENKSKTTIYRYLKSYIEKGLIIESGRIIKGKRNTAERMFTQSAKIFFIDNQYLDAWEQGQRSNTLALKIGLLAQNKFDDRGFDIEILKELLKDYEFFIQSSALQVLKNVSAVHPEIGTKIFALDNDQKLVFFSVLKNSLFYLTKDKLLEFKNELENIFMKAPLNIHKLIAESMKEEKKHNEIIIDKPSGYQTSFTRKTVHFMDYKTYTKYVHELNYNALFIIFGLNDFPLGIKTIVEKFPTAYEIEYKYLESKKSEEGLPIVLKNDEESSKILSESRIYSLIQDLKEDGLVIEAGRQINKQTSKTSILYTTKGKRFIYLENRDEFWRQKTKWKAVVQLVGQILQSYFGTSHLDESTFYSLLTKIEKLKFDSFKEMLTDAPTKEISDFFHYSLNGIELNSSISSLGNINVFFQKDDIFELVNTLQDLFYKN